jgi:hypothetical protein
MNHFFVRRKAFAVAALSAASVLVACEDKRVKQLDTGITRDSAVSVIAHDLAPGSPPDSFPNVYKRERYLIAGKNLEVLYFTPDNKKQVVKSGQTPKDTIDIRKLTPLVFVENRMIGRGWPFWDSVATANKIQLPASDKK